MAQAATGTWRRQRQRPAQPLPLRAAHQLSAGGASFATTVWAAAIVALRRNSAVKRGGSGPRGQLVGCVADLEWRTANQKQQTLIKQRRTVLERAYLTVPGRLPHWSRNHLVSSPEPAGANDPRIHGGQDPHREWGKDVGGGGEGEGVGQAARAARATSLWLAGMHTGNTQPLTNGALYVCCSERGWSLWRLRAAR